ncbi:cobalamin B12-binding domain-containing protein [Anaerovorax sp. IOR16]|uniref:cobalamin B12-binding domain-containing protein n=1 Tax=Anaerovorax sp. IOR16 TaxID=2773458 RepID=UPI0019D233CB|nr:corrinoid protein [Anaerovorax sp. IOR16]
MCKEELMKLAFDSIVEADEDSAMESMDKAAEAGISAVEMLKEGFSKGMNELGDQFGRGEIFLPELIFATEVMKAVTERVETELLESGETVTQKGKIVMATVEGDVHDIGKGICVSLLKTCGFDVYDLGREVPASVIIDKAEEVGADIIGTSALLTTTMTVQQEIENELKSRGIRDKYKTMIGGAPVTQRWAEKIGADAYTEDASECCERAQRFLENK